MADMVFEIGRYLAFIGVFFFLAFGVAFWRFKQELDRNNLSLAVGSESDIEGEVEQNAVGLGETVLYLRARQFESAEPMLQKLGQHFRAPVIIPFYAGVWTFCAGLALMSATFGFVLFN